MSPASAADAALAAPAAPAVPVLPGRMARFIRRRPLASFFLWFFTVGQAIVFVPLIARHTSGVELPAQPFLLAATFVGLLVPTVVITWLTDGLEGLVALRRRAVTVRAPARWYGLVVLGVPLIAVAGVAAALAPPQVGATTLTTAFTTGFLLQLIAVFLTVNLWEEIAWMGLVQARLQDRHGPIRAAVLTAPVFALGHVSQLIDETVTATLVMLATLTAVAIPFRALLGWVGNRTDSLFLVGLLHGAANAVGTGSILGVGMLEHLYPGQGSGGLVVPLLAVVGLAVIAATRGRLGRTAPTTADQRSEVTTAAGQE